MPTPFVPTVTYLSTGFELEFCEVNSSDASSPTYQGKPLAARNTWKFRTDSSCGRTGSTGYEINSPVVRSKHGLNDELAFLSQWLTVTGAQVIDTCGFHIHVGNLTEEAASAVLSFFARYEEVFFSLVPNHRRGNNYCTRLSPSMRAGIVRGASFESLSDAWGAARPWLNANSFRKHGTLEVRLPEGTTNIKQIKGWIHLVVACCEGIVTKFQSNGKFRNSAKLTASNFLPMAVHDMLNAAGLYGANLQRKIGWGDGKLAREFVASRFAEINGYTYRTKLDAWLKERRKCRDSQASQTRVRCDWDADGHGGTVGITRQRLRRSTIDES